MTGTQSLVDRFQQLANTQKDLIAEAEREVTVWKNAHRSCDGEIAALRQEVATLKQNAVESDGANPLLLCLIDGDGCIFNDKLLMLGLEGGREAAQKLRQHIIGHYGSNQNLLVHVFFNREGLGKTLKTYLNIQPATFNAFITGFNTASPLMSMLDVGTAKEAADAKIREQMRIFVQFPNVKRIYFGGGHDNGYVNNLTMVQNEGYLDKIVLLQSYTQLAFDIKALGLPCLENDGVFLAEKLSYKTAQPNLDPKPATPGITRSKSGMKGTTETAPSSSLPGKIKIARGKDYKSSFEAVKALKPRACNHHYLTEKGCPMPSACRYSHAYEFSPDMLTILREVVKQNPCLLLVKGQACIDTECPYAHKCPQGQSCEWRREGKCKFSIAGMHGSPTPSIQNSDDDRVLLAPRVPALHARNGSSSSIGDYTSSIGTPSPKKKAAKLNQGTLNRLAQTKQAFKSSVSGSTQAERLAQMGVVRVGAASLHPKDEQDDEESEEVLSVNFGSFRQPGIRNEYTPVFRVID